MSHEREATKKTGTFLGIPYDWRWMSWAKVKERMWNPSDPRVFTPRVFGWGWSLNLYQLFRRLKIMRRP